MPARRLLIAFLLVCAFAIPGVVGSPPFALAGSADDWLLEPGEAGPIDATSTLAGLRSRLGAANVQATKVPVGEGETEAGAILFPSNPEKRIAVIWHDARAMARPREALITGKKTLWHTSQGITLGTTLKQLEKLNGKPFRLLGMAWDYEGAITNWNGGRLASLERADDCRVAFRLSGEAPGGHEQIEPIIGDSEFSSSHPAFQALNPAVRVIHVFFPQGGEG